MAAVELEFALDVSNGRLSGSYLASVPFTLPKLVAGDTVSLRIRLVKPRIDAQPGTYALVPLDGVTMRVAIGTAGAALTNADLVVDGDALVGDLPLNVAPITGLTFPAEKVFEFRISFSGGSYKHLQVPVTLIASVLAVTTIPTEPPDEALTKNEARASYVPIDGGEQGQWFCLKDQTTGIAYRIYVKDGELRCDAPAA